MHPAKIVANLHKQFAQQGVSAESLGNKFQVGNLAETSSLQLLMGYQTDLHESWTQIAKISSSARVFRNGAHWVSEMATSVLQLQAFFLAQNFSITKEP